MGRTIDATFIQSRMINTRKGPAVHSLRAQADKARYSAFMRRVLLETPNLTLLQGEAKEILVNPDGTVGGIVTTHGASYSCLLYTSCPRKMPPGCWFPLKPCWRALSGLL